MAGLNTEESPLQDSINREDRQDQEKKVWCLLKRAIELNLSITETALWGTITVLRRVRALKRDMLKTSPRGRCRLRSGLIRHFGLDQEGQRSPHQNHKNTQKDSKEDDNWNWAG